MKKLIRSMGKGVVKTVRRFMPNDYSENEKKIMAAVSPFTMTSDERIISLIRAVEYTSRAGIGGAFVECGVWRGGSMMAVAMQLMAMNDTSRDLYLYDTFEGMSKPSEKDVQFDNQAAADLLSKEKPTEGIWCHAGLAEVRKNMESTGYPAGKIHYVPGKVEDTIPGTIPQKIALLRLDTDWYESTRHELHHLFPLLDPRGALIIDDYGHWQGCRKAVDEYFADKRSLYYFHRIDYTGRLIMRVYCPPENHPS